MLGTLKILKSIYNIFWLLPNVYISLLIGEEATTSSPRAAVGIDIYLQIIENTFFPYWGFLQIG